jgi:hypothetical protein
MALVAAQGTIGGISSVLQGGKFGHGFISAGLTKAININNGIDCKLGFVPRRKKWAK